MTLSKEHEDIVDDLAYAIADYNCTVEFEDAICVVIEHIMAACMVPGLKNLGLHADAYICLNDGYAIVPVEVGRMKDGKWDHVLDVLDDNPVRILRIDFTKNVYWIRPRRTSREDILIEQLSACGFVS